MTDNNDQNNLTDEALKDSKTDAVESFFTDSSETILMPAVDQPLPPEVEDISTADVDIPRKKKKRNRFLSLIKYSLLILIALFLVVATEYMAFANRIQPNIMVGDIPIGGMTKDKAESELVKQYREALKEPVILKYRNKDTKITPTTLQTRVFYGQTVDIAYDIGRDGSAIENAKVRLDLLLDGRRMTPKNDFNEEQLKGLLRKYANIIDVPKVEAHIDIRDHKAELIPSKIGEKIDQKILLKNIKQQLFMTSKKRIEVDPKNIQPRVTTTNAEQAFKDTVNILKSKITLVEDKGPFKASLASKDLEETIIFNEMNQDTGLGKRSVKYLAVGFEPNKMTDLLMESVASLIREPKDAKFTFIGGVLKISSSDNGRTIDTLETSQKVLESAKLGGASEVPIIFVDKIPSITTENAKSFGITERISTFTTNYPIDDPERVRHILAVSSALNGTLLEPGRTLSFNEKIGPDIAAMNYDEKPILKDGKVQNTLGTGAVQVSTTLFNAVFFAGLKIDERHNNSFYIAQFPPGRDAAVAYPAPDLRFTNDLSKYILIQVTNNNGSLTVDMYSTKSKREVFLKSSGFSNFIPFITSTVNEASLEVGQSSTKEEGIEGRRITVTRTVKEGGKVIHNDTFSSYYVPKNQVLSVGVMPPSTTTTSTTTSTTSTTTTTIPLTTTTTLPPTTTTTIF